MRNPLAGPKRIMFVAVVFAAPLIQAQMNVLRSDGIEPLLWPRGAGSYPGYVFTDLRAGEVAFSPRPLYAAV